MSKIPIGLKESNRREKNGVARSQQRRQTIKRRCWHGGSAIRKSGELLLFFLFVGGCASPTQKLPPISDDTAIRLINPQSVFYKNASVLLTFDSNAEIRCFEILLQKKTDGQPITVSAYRQALPTSLTGIVSVRLDGFDDYEDGVYQIALIIEENQTAKTVITDELTLTSQVKENAPLRETAFLDHYPFTLYSHDGMFEQTTENCAPDDSPFTSNLIYTTPEGCAVFPESVPIYKSFQTPCAILNEENCQFIDVEPFLPENDAIVKVGKSEYGYRDEAFAQQNRTISGKDFRNWLNDSVHTEKTLVPNCFILNLAWEERNGIHFSFPKQDQEITFDFIYLENAAGTYVIITDSAYGAMKPCAIVFFEQSFDFQ